MIILTIRALARRHHIAGLSGDHADVPPRREGYGAGEELGPCEKPNRDGQGPGGAAVRQERRVVHREASRGATPGPVGLAFQHYAYSQVSH
jgi:hypothetical protein